MKTTKNDITGDRLVSKTSDKYRDNYDNIFKTKKEEVRPENGKMCVPQLNGTTMACIKYEDFKKYGYDDKYMWTEKDNVRFPVINKEDE